MNRVTIEEIPVYFEKRSIMLKLQPQTVRNVLLLGAHSDDIEIGAGGSVLRLVELYPKAHFHWVVMSGDARRAKEARASARDYLRGAKDTTIRTFDFRDGFFPYHGMAIKEAFEGLKKEIEPDLIFTHCSHDRHQDHRLMCELTWNSFRGHLVLEYEIPKYDGDLSSPNCFIALDPKQAKRKAALLMRHFATQRNKHWFTEDLFLGLMRLRGIEANSGTPYAEGFYARKMVLL